MTTVNLQGKNALVTGSSRGLGRQYAMDLARAGANVIVHDISDKAAAQFNEAPSGSDVAWEIARLGVKTAFIAADVSDPQQVKELIEQSVREMGSLDILVNNAGGDIGYRTPRPNPNDCLDIAVEDIRAVVERRNHHMLEIVKGATDL